MLVQPRRFRIEARARKEIAKNDVTPQHRRTNDERRDALTKHTPSQFDGFANGADPWRLIEGGAGLVVEEGRTTCFQGPERRRKFASICFGDMAREPPAIPKARKSAKVLSCVGEGGFRNRTVLSPATESASITSVEPVKSSP